MKTPSRSMLAFAAGAGAAMALGWGGAASAQLGGDQPVIYVCAASDGVLRLVAPGASCPAGQRSLRLKRAEADLEPPKTDDESGKSCTGADQKKLAELEQRLKDVEETTDRGAVTSRVTEPFEVVDRQGRKVLSIAQEKVITTGGQGLGNTLRLFNTSTSTAVAQISAIPSGGYFFGSSGGGKMSAAVGADDVEGGSFRVSDNTNTQHTGQRIFLGRDATREKSYRLEFLSADAKPVAEIGELPQTKGGVAEIYDDKGGWRVGMFYWDNNGSLMIRHGAAPNAKIVVNLSEGVTGGGRLQLMSADGEKMVEAGVTAQHFGVVSAGPASFKPGMGLLGLPGSYISGKPD